MQHCTKEQLIRFEDGIQKLWEAGKLPYLIHLSGGNEEPLIELFKNVQPGDWVFSGHRNHYHYLLGGGDPVHLEEMIRNGRSMFIYGRSRYSEAGSPLDVDFLSSSILAGTCGIAAGVALQIKEETDRFAAPCICDCCNQMMEISDSYTHGMDIRSACHSKKRIFRRPARVWCFLGDGAEDEGHFYEAVMLVEGNHLPCTFVIEDNDRSVDTDKAKRRGDWKNPLHECACVRRYEYTATFPHAGNGCKKQIQFDPEVIEQFNANQPYQKT